MTCRLEFILEFSKNKKLFNRCRKKTYCCNY